MKETFNLQTSEQIVAALQRRGPQAKALQEYAREIKLQSVGNQVYLRGLIEYSNCCSKSCYYCGIRGGNPQVHRYTVSTEETLEAARFAYENGFGSIVLQAGERNDKAYTQQIEKLLLDIDKISKGELGITLSLGEQNRSTLLRWKQAGAKRYLLRIEASDPTLYAKLHPADHSYQKRLECIDLLKDLNYQVGTGVMIGLPFQTYENLAQDLLFFQKRDIDMIGMGPYIEHAQTPLYAYKDQLLSIEERYILSLNMLAVLRILMPDINIASTTAMGSLKKEGREEAIRIAANVIMPNLTPFSYREDYFLYQDKICINESNADSKINIEALVQRAGCKIAYHAHGDSHHFFNRQKR
ncbi:MAG: [FeFe] hydrogenase H-cluster radical SAM maturase HydE [Bacteroidales bacterium]